MSLEFSQDYETDTGALEPVEHVLDAAGWPQERGDDTTVQCIAPTRWGEMGGLFSFREEPRSVHYSLTLDIRPLPGRKGQLAELVMMVNERLWIGHFDYWQDEGVILFRHAIPLADRSEPTEGEISAILAASIDAVERFIPAFNFLIWAGKSPAEALEAAMFETEGEA
jgi:hypothetical protein